jgi:hypothetical protein
MKFRTHLKLFVFGTAAWIVFWIAGLPSYYQQYSQKFMIWFDLLLLPTLTFLFLVILRRMGAGRRMKRSLWMAFYFTVPLALYDWFYCGLFLGHGLTFLSQYWYLSIYYFIPWVILPALAFWLNRADAQKSKPSH